MEELKRKDQALQEIKRRKAYAEAQQRATTEAEQRATAETQVEAHQPIASSSTRKAAGKFGSNHGYEFAVVNKAHRLLNPPCERPAFRILGLFRSQQGDLQNWIDDLWDNGQLQQEPDTGVTKCKLGDLHMLPICKYMLISKNSTRDRDPKYVENKIDEIKRIHLEQQAFAKAEFEEHKRKQVQGKMGLSLNKQREQAKEKRKTAPREKALKQMAKRSVEARSSMREVGRVPGIMQLMHQRFAVIVLLHDVTPNTLQAKDDPEPAVMVVDAFDAESEARKFVESLENHVHAVDLHIVDMYQWHFPEDVDLDQVTEKYRNPEQDKIMAAKKQTKEEIAKAEAEAAADETVLPVTEVTEESKAPEGFNPLKSLETNQGLTYTESSEPVDREALERENLEREALEREQSLEESIYK